ncbi:MAG: DEAD/DEAH box helicase, partial [Shewanella sp.]
MSFSALSLHSQLVNTLAELGYRQPTPIQIEAIPAILAKQDVMAGAQTGTGKTAAFALPILQLLLLDNESSDAPKEIRALVLVPTRELAVQVQQSFVKYAKGTDIRIGIAYGGVSVEAQQAEFKAGIDVLIATPGRLLDHLRQGALNLKCLSVLVFDEADRMLDMGFMDEIKAVLKQVPAQRQTLLFSATLDDSIFGFSKNLLREPKLIEVAKRNTTAAQVEQRVYAIDS